MNTKIAFGQCTFALLILLIKSCKEQHFKSLAFKSIHKLNVAVDSIQSFGMLVLNKLNSIPQPVWKIVSILKKLLQNLIQ